MTRRRALLIAGMVTAAVVAMVVGAGASFGQFGFADAGERAGVTVPADQGTTVDGQAADPVGWDDEDEHGEWEDDDRYEHEDGDDDGEEHDDTHEAYDDD